jgi:hypothetical protein
MLSAYATCVGAIRTPDGLQPMSCPTAEQCSMLWGTAVWCLALVSRHCLCFTGGTCNASPCKQQTAAGCDDQRLWCYVDL